MTDILLVEDEAPIRMGLVELFKNQDFNVTAVADGKSALDAFKNNSFDIALLDIMLPELSGLEVLKEVRAMNKTLPVLMLTARGTEDDIVAGLEAGADDYVTKPFGVSELLARVKGLLRRAPSKTPLVYHSQNHRIDLGALVIEHEQKQLSLTAREASFLQFIIERKERAVSRDELLVAVWGYSDGSIATRTIDVHVAALRAKLKSIDAGDWVQTVRGRGYRFMGEVKA